MTIPANQPATPAISVVMPVYNVEAYIADAIQSVLDQSFTDFELIIVDDGGTDNSIAIAQSFDDDRIRIIHQANRGLAGARNTGIFSARAPLIALLDSDDLYHKDKLMLHHVHMRASPEIGVSYAGSRMIDGKGNVMSVAMRPKLTDITPTDIFCRNPVGNGSAAVLRRSVIDRAVSPHPSDPHRICWFDEDFRQSEDIEFWTRLAVLHSVKFEGIAGLLTDYRIIGGALSANIVNQYVSWEKMHRKITEIAPMFAARYGSRARGYQLRYLARRAVQLGDLGFSTKLLTDALRTYPGMIWREPVKTAVTGLAVLAGRLLGPERFGRITRRYLKGAAA